MPSSYHRTGMQGQHHSNYNCYNQGGSNYPSHWQPAKSSEQREDTTQVEMKVSEWHKFISDLTLNSNLLQNKKIIFDFWEIITSDVKVLSLIPLDACFQSILHESVHAHRATH